jgi:hypothetical protein
MAGDDRHNALACESLGSKEVNDRHQVLLNIKGPGLEIEANQRSSQWVIVWMK